jgi:antitoxin (DNA-binding transcriptional repressor) of toxin-antitoxin stability system
MSKISEIRPSCDIMIQEEFDQRLAASILHALEKLMIQIPAKQAATSLEKLLDEATQGQEVVIIGADGSAFKLIALPRIPEPVFGSAKGLVHIGADFDAPIEGLEEYMP